MALDSQVASLAGIARRVAKTQKISAAVAFEKITKGLATSKPPQRRRVLSPLDGVTYVYDPTDIFPELSADEKRYARESTLRFDLEVALLRLDACCSFPVASVVTYPSRDDLNKLDGLVNETAEVVSKHWPVPGWPVWQKVDRHFPKLRLWKRVVGFVTRIAASTPPRPLGVLSRPTGSKDE